VGEAKFGGIALSYAQRAVALAPNESEAHTSVAVSYGKLLPLQGAREQASASQKIKDSVDRALRLDPSTTRPSMSSVAGTASWPTSARSSAR
jgi:hypothetical protein